MQMQRVKEDVREHAVVMEWDMPTCSWIDILVILVCWRLQPIFS